MTWFPFLRRRHAWQEQLDAYLDGELSPADASSFEAHLEACGACTAELTEASAIARAFAALPELEAPRSFRLTEAMVAAPAKPLPAPQPRGYPRAAAGVMAAAFAVFAVLVVVDTQGQGSDDMNAASDFSTEGAAGAEMSGLADPDASPPADNATTTDGDSGAPEAQADAEDGRSAGGEENGEAVSLLAAEDDDGGWLDGMRLAQFGAIAVAIAALGALVYTNRRADT